MGTSFLIVAREQAPRWSQVKIKSMSKASWVWPEGEKTAEKPEAFVLMPPQPYQILVSWFDWLDHWLSCKAQCPQAPPERLQRRQQSYQRAWQFLKKGYNLRPLLSLLRYFPLPPCERFAYLIFLGPPTVAHNCHGKTKNLTAKTKYPRQNRKPHGKNKITHGKTKNLTAKTKYLTTKPKTLRQNQRPHGKPC